MFYGYVYEETLFVKFEDIESLHVYYADSVHVFPKHGWALFTYKLDNLPEVEFKNLKMEEYHKMLKVAFKVDIFECFM